MYIYTATYTTLSHIYLYKTNLHTTTNVYTLLHMSIHCHTYPYTATRTYTLHKCGVHSDSGSFLQVSGFACSSRLSYWITRCMHRGRTDTLGQFAQDRWVRRIKWTLFERKGGNPIRRNSTSSSFLERRFCITNNCENILKPNIIDYAAFSMS